MGNIIHVWDETTTHYNISLKSVLWQRGPQIDGESMPRSSRLVQLNQPIYKLAEAIEDTLFVGNQCSLIQLP